MNAVTARLFIACNTPLGEVDDFDKRYRMAQAEIEGGADVNAKYPVRVLLYNDIFFWTSLGMDEQISPMYLACQGGSVELVKMLENAGATDDRALYAAADKFHFARNNIELMEYLLRKGFDPRFKHATGQTVLDAAVFSCCPDTVQFLLGSGARIEDCKNNPLVALGRLLPGGDNVEDEDAIPIEVDFEDFDADQIAYIKSKVVAVARLLLESGADPNACGIDGRSVHEIAIQRDCLEMADLLFDHQIKLSCFAEDEMTSNS